MPVSQGDYCDIQRTLNPRLESAEQTNEKTWLRTTDTTDRVPEVLVEATRPGVDERTVEAQAVGIVTIASRGRPIEAATATIVCLGTIPVPGVNKVVRERTPVSTI